MNIDTMMRLIFILLILGLHKNIFGQNIERDRVLAAQKRYDQAIEQKDSTALRLLFHPSMIITGGDGSRRDAATEIKDCVDPRYNVVYFKTENIEVDLFEKTAIVRGDIQWQLKNGDREMTINRRITFTYVQRRNDWVILAQHIGMPPKP